MPQKNGKEPPPQPAAALQHKNTSLRQMEAIIKLFGAKTDEEEDEDREEEERQAKIEAYLESLDPQRRKFEERKMNAYKLQGKNYYLPNEAPDQKRGFFSMMNSRKGSQETDSIIESSDLDQFSVGSSIRITIVDKCNRATDMDKEEMKQKVVDVRQAAFTRFSKASNLMGLPETKKKHSQFSLLTQRDNVKLRRKRKLLADDKLNRLKFQMMQKAKEFKKEQMKIFAGVPEQKTVKIIPTLN